MRRHKDPYEPYEALAPLYQGDKPNLLPALLGLLWTLDLSDEAMHHALAFEKEKEDLYELTDVTYPKTPLEEAYVAKTNRYLIDINALGIDVTLGRELARYATTQSSLRGAHLVRLAYAKTSKHDLMVAQALALCDVVGEPVERTGDYVDGTKLRTRLAALLVEEEGADNQLFVDEDLASDLQNWVTVLLDHYLQTSDVRVLDALLLLEAYWHLEDLLVDPLGWLRQWMLVSQTWLVEEGLATPVIVEELVPWRTMRETLHQVGDAHRALAIATLYEVFERFALPAAQTAASHLYLG